MDPRDADLRLAVYRAILKTAQIPTVAELARERGVGDQAVRHGLRRLADAHALVIGDDGEIAMAHPFSAAATDFTVAIGPDRYRANCAWDALAIPAMLYATARVDARCHCPCAESLPLRFDDGALEPIGAVVHFAVPPRRFYDDIRFT